MSCVIALGAFTQILIRSFLEKERSLDQCWDEITHVVDITVLTNPVPKSPKQQQYNPLSRWISARVPLTLRLASTNTTNDRKQFRDLGETRAAISGLPHLARASNYLSKFFARSETLSAFSESRWLTNTQPKIGATLAWYLLAGQKCNARNTHLTEH